MDFALVIQATPAIAFYNTTRPASPDLAYPRLTAVSEISLELRKGSGSTPAARVTIDNADGAITDRCANAQLRQPAAITRDGETVFSGVVVAIAIGAEIIFSLES